MFRLRSDLARFNGHLDIAQDLCEQAITELRASDSTTPLIMAHAAMGSIQTARGDLDNAGKSLVETNAMKFPERLGVEVARAELPLAQGQFQPAADGMQAHATIRSGCPAAIRNTVHSPPIKSIKT